MTPAADGPREQTSTMRRDVLSAYAASGAKMLSWVVVSAVVFRLSPVEFAVLALVRGTLGLLNYTTLGLAPAMVRLLAASKKDAAASLVPESRHAVPLASGSPALAYETPASVAPDPMRPVYASALIIAWGAAALSAALAYGYAAGLGRIHVIPDQVRLAESIVIWMAIGLVFRLVSEASGAVVQVKARIARDNISIVVGEVIWVALACGMLLNETLRSAPAAAASVAFGLSGIMLWVLRSRAAHRELALRWLRWKPASEATRVMPLLAAGSLIAVAQLADFLYAPTDYILINRLISPEAVARYAPAVQIDAGLLLLVGALAAVLLPKAAIAHTTGDHSTLRRYYVVGTLASAALLLTAGVAVYFLSPLIFRLWLGEELPQTQAILPLVLVHTVVGGSAGVGRSILLGMGKVKPFAIAALVAGAANVVMSYVFVKYFGLGLTGIVCGTIVAVVGRCVLWQPWYVRRTLRREAAADAKPLEPAAVALPPEPL